MNEEEMREIFREMREEPVPADSLARVRQGVEQRRRRTAPWKILAALAAAACIVAGFILLRPARTPVQIQEPSQPEIAQVLPRPARDSGAAHSPAPKQARPSPGLAKVEPVLIRIETPDPDVVILLVNLTKEY